MKHAAYGLAPLALWTLLQGLPEQPDRAALTAAGLDLSVHVEQIDGEVRASVTASNMPVQRVIGALAAELELDVEGFDAVLRSALVTVELHDRELNQVLEFVLGSVGLTHEMRPGSITVMPTGTGTTGVEELLDLAQVAYLRATNDFPYHALGAAARLSQGEIEERRGNFAAALTHYDFAIENYRASPELPHAMARAARALEELGLYSDAESQYRELANLEQPHGYVAQSWMGMVRTTNQLGDYQGALHILGAMDSDVRAQSRGEERQRLVQRVVALNGLHRFEEALRSLHALDKLGLDELARARSYALRAVTWEGLGQLGEARHSWMIYSRGAEGLECEKALENAARLALLADDELEVLLICEEAESLGLGPRLTPYVLEARRRLGMENVEHAASASPLEKLALAEGWMEEARHADAAQVLEELWHERGNLEEDAIARVYRLRARIVAAGVNLDAALSLLRVARARLELRENRAVLDRAAAELLEQGGRFAEAVDAYGGSY